LPSFTPFTKIKNPAFAGVFMLFIEMSIISCQTQKPPWVSSPVAATGTDTDVCRDFWHHDFILSETVRGNMTKKKSPVKPENKLVVV
jgi:hypothetical protein